MAEEFHISSLLVQGRNEALPAIAARIAELPGAEVHGEAAQGMSQGMSQGRMRGKMIVTLETDSETETLAQINRIQDIEGVITASLVFHQVEEADESEEARP